MNIIVKSIEPSNHLNLNFLSILIISYLFSTDPYKLDNIIILSEILCIKAVFQQIKGIYHIKFKHFTDPLKK